MAKRLLTDARVSLNQALHLFDKATNRLEADEAVSNRDAILMLLAHCLEKLFKGLIVDSGASIDKAESQVDKAYNEFISALKRVVRVSLKENAGDKGVEPKTKRHRYTITAEEAINTCRKLGLLDDKQRTVALLITELRHSAQHNVVDVNDSVLYCLLVSAVKMFNNLVSNPAIRKYKIKPVDIPPNLPRPLSAYVGTNDPLQQAIAEDLIAILILANSSDVMEAKTRIVSYVAIEGVLGECAGEKDYLLHGAVPDIATNVIGRLEDLPSEGSSLQGWDVVLPFTSALRFDESRPVPLYIDRVDTYLYSAVQVAAILSKNAQFSGISYAGVLKLLKLSGETLNYEGPNPRYGKKTQGLRSKPVPRYNKQAVNLLAGAIGSSGTTVKSLLQRIRKESISLDSIMSSPKRPDAEVTTTTRRKPNDRINRHPASPDAGPTETADDQHGEADPR